MPPLGGRAASLYIAGPVLYSPYLRLVRATAAAGRRRHCCPLSPDTQYYRRAEGALVAAAAAAAAAVAAAAAAASAAAAAIVSLVATRRRCGAARAPSRSLSFLHVGSDVSCRHRHFEVIVSKVFLYEFYKSRHASQSAPPAVCVGGPAASIRWVASRSVLEVLL